jgi:pilus assembly protein CpaF
VCPPCSFELQIPLPDVVAMQTRQASLEGTGEITLRHLVEEALRMRPNRIIVGEVRQQEALDLLIALNSGLPGMGTVHANSAREAITKMCTLSDPKGEHQADGYRDPSHAPALPGRDDCRTADTTTNVWDESRPWLGQRRAIRRGGA